MKLVRLLAIALCVAALSWAAFAQTPVREGNWEVTMQMEMPGVDVKLPDFKSTQCITKEQLKDPAQALPQGIQDKNNDCKVSDYKPSGNKATWKLTCTIPVPISGSGEITYTGDTYDGSMTMTTGAGDMTMKYKGKRLGDCVK